MTDKNDREKRYVDADGVKIVTSAGVRRSVWLLALAIGLVGIAVVVLRSALHNVEEPASQRLIATSAQHNTGAPRAPAQPMPPSRAAPVELRRLPAANALPTPSNDAPSTATPRTDQAVDESPDAPEAAMFGPVTPGAPSGVALFPPPGTKPIKRGIVVPDDFELPPGYVRHYQATDDGRLLAAILMFHPDFQPVDEHGVPIPVPADRVVPAELAPPGLPLQLLEIPEPQNQDTIP